MAMEQAPMQEQQAPAAGQGTELEDLITNIGTGLSMFREVASQVSPEVGQKLEAIMQEFASVVEAVAGGAPAQAAAQPATPEQGAVESAPINPARR